jgi:hypothetical protein
MGAKRSCPLIVCPNSTPIPNFKAVLVVFVPSPPLRTILLLELDEKKAFVWVPADVERARKIPISVALAGFVLLNIIKYAGILVERFVPPIETFVGRIEIGSVRTLVFVH